MRARRVNLLRFEHLAHKRAVARKCSRRYRARQRNGTRCLHIEITNAEQTLDAFIRVGVLQAERRNDDAAIEAAIATLCRAGYRAFKSRAETCVVDR
jgi:hypothetical protein